VLEKHTIFEAKEWELIGGWSRWFFCKQHHEVEGV
jgi:hypothetical protein